jgi:four helix bundle protein
MAEAIKQPLIYTAACKLEDEVYDLVKKFPAGTHDELGEDLRRSSSAVAHHIMRAFELSSPQLRLDYLVAARREAEAVHHYLEDAAKDLGADPELIEGYTRIIQQSWGLDKWIRSGRSFAQAEPAARSEKEDTRDAA